MNYSILLHDEQISYLFASARHTDVECVTHLHNSMEIVIVTEGILNMTIGEYSYAIPKGSAAFVPAYEPHEFHSPHKNVCHVLMFSSDLAAYLFDGCDDLHPKTHIFPLSDIGMSLVERILPHEQNEADYIHAMAVLAPILCEIYEKCGFVKGKPTCKDRFSEILSYMDLHFAEDITLERVADAVGIHPVTLSRRFSEYAKTNFSAHLNYLRCNHAANLIKSTSLTFSEIAFLSGFGSIRTFNRAFRTLFHATPSEFKQMPTI